MMYIKYEDIHAKYDPIRKIRGIIHVGACTGEERDAYVKCGVPRVAWFEANPETYRILYENVRKLDGHEAHNIMLSDAYCGFTSFHVTSNFRAASSSMLKLAKHAIHYPNITVTKKLTLPERRFDAFVRDAAFPIDEFNFLNMDVQGAEMRVLRGMGELVSKFDYVYSEINTDELYEGCVQLPELEKFLDNLGYVRCETNLTPYSWGDALFVRKEIHEKATLDTK